jgi:hypothetical protein
MKPWTKYVLFGLVAYVAWAAYRAMEIKKRAGIHTLPLEWTLTNPFSSLEDYGKSHNV